MLAVDEQKERFHVKNKRMSTSRKNGFNVKNTHSIVHPTLRQTLQEQLIIAVCFLSRNHVNSSGSSACTHNSILYVVCSGVFSDCSSRDRHTPNRPHLSHPTSLVVNPPCSLVLDRVVPYTHRQKGANQSRIARTICMLLLHTNLPCFVEQE